MCSLTYIFLSVCFLGCSSIYTKTLFAGDVIDLGSYTTSVAIGKGPIPRRYKPLTDVDEKTIHNAQIVINKLRSNFSTSVLTLPALDPYVGKNFQAIALDHRNLPFSGKIIIKRIRMTGAKQFYLRNIEIRMNNLRTDFNLTIPQLNGNATFDAHLLLEGILPVTNKAKVRITISGIKVNGTVWGAEKPQSKAKVYSIEGLRIDLHINDIKIQLLKTNLSDFELQTLSSTNSRVSKKEFIAIIGAIRNKIARKIVTRINNMLKKHTVTQVKDYFIDLQNDALRNNPE